MFQSFDQAYEMIHRKNVVLVLRTETDYDFNVYREIKVQEKCEHYDRVLILRLSD